MSLTVELEDWRDIRDGSLFVDKHDDVFIRTDTGVRGLTIDVETNDPVDRYGPYAPYTVAVKDVGIQLYTDMADHVVVDGRLGTPRGKFTRWEEVPEGQMFVDADGYRFMRNWFGASALGHDERISRSSGPYTAITGA